MLYMAVFKASFWMSSFYLSVMNDILMPIRQGLSAPRDFYACRWSQLLQRVTAASICETSFNAEQSQIQSKKEQHSTAQHPPQGCSRADFQASVESVELLHYSLPMI